MQVPQLSVEKDTDLYVYYGNPTAENQQSPTNVWGNGYVGVWHMNDDPAGAVRDSTRYANNTDERAGGMQRDTHLRSGKINESIYFDGDDHIGAPTSDSLDFSNKGVITTSVWFKPDTTTRGGLLMWEDFARPSNGGEPWKIIFQSNGTVAVRVNDVAGGSAAGETVLPTDTWHYAVGVADGSTISAYVNGSINATGSQTANLKAPTIGSAAKWVIGREEFNQASRTFDGLIDEIRISNVVRSDAWVTTEYRNQCDCEDFLTIAESETQSSSTTTADSASNAPASFSPMIQVINSLYRTAYNRGPTFDEWLYWANRVIAEDKPTFPSLLGAMQWQRLFGPTSP